MDFFRAVLKCYIYIIVSSKQLYEIGSTITFTL